MIVGLVFSFVAGTIYARLPVNAAFQLTSGKKLKQHWYGLKMYRGIQYETCINMLIITLIYSNSKTLFVLN